MSDQTPISMSDLQDQIDELYRDNAILSAQLTALNQLVANLLSAEAISTGLWSDWPAAVAKSVTNIRDGQMLGRVDIGFEPNNPIDKAVADFLAVFLQTAVDMNEAADRQEK